MDKSLKEESGILEEKIAEETFAELKKMPSNLRPRKISLYGANPKHLIKIMIALQDKFKKISYKAEVFIGSSKNGEYSVDVGHYLRLYSEKYDK